MKIQFVETNNMIGWTSEYTSSTMVIATLFQLKRDNIKQLERFGYVWIDNGAYEAGLNGQISFNNSIRKQIQLAKKLQHIHRTFLVLPDVLLDYNKTINAYFRYINKIRENVPSNTTLVGVIQGVNNNEIESMCRTYKSNGIKYIGIPKKMREMPDYNNFKYVIKRYYNPRWIHYMGFVPNDLHDDMICEIHSMDTKHPINNALKRENISFNNTTYFDTVPSKFLVKRETESFILKLQLAGVSI